MRQWLSRSCGRAKGASVTAISNEPDQIERNRAYFRYLQVPESSVRFECRSLYNIDELSSSFDDIFCIEVLEHLTRDWEVVGKFRSLIEPSGRLVVCCPFSDHPEHKLGRTNEPENGWHVRDGYTEASFSSLLTAAGFAVEQTVGVGGSLVTVMDRGLRVVRHKLGRRRGDPSISARRTYRPPRSDQWGPATQSRRYAVRSSQCAETLPSGLGPERQQKRPQM